MDTLQERTCPHWIPAHRGTVGGRPDAAWLADWRPQFVKIVTDDETVPYIEDVPRDAKIIIRNYPLSELGHDRGFKPSAAPPAALAPAVLPQDGSGRDAYVAGPGAFAVPLPLGGEWLLTRSATSVPEDVGKLHAAICDRIAQWCEGRGVPRTRLLFEGLNEPMLWSVEPPAQVARYYRAFLLALHGYGLRGVCGNFGVGWPGNGGVKDAPVQWGFFKPMIDAMIEGDFLGLHEYWNLSGPGENWRWWAGRYEQCPYRVPILITECGIDTGVAGNPGGGWQWLPGQMTQRASRYVDELAWYLQRCAADGRIHGIFPFTYDRGSATWEWFDNRNEDWLKAFLARADMFPAPTVRKPEGSPTDEPKPAPVDKLLTQLQTAFGAQLTDLRKSLPVHATARYATRYSGQVKRLIVHHTAADAGRTWTAVAEYHVGKGYPGIGYHFGITPDGRVSILNGLDVISYHAGAANADSAAICFAGNFRTETPTPAAMASYRKLVGVLQTFLGRALPVLGHRDVGQTVCPGDNLYRLIFDLDEPAPDPALLAAVLRKAGETAELPVNPAAALLKRIWADDRSPTSPEYTVSFGTVNYVCQTARKPGEATPTVYYCRSGDWSNVNRLS